MGGKAYHILIYSADLCLKSLPWEVSPAGSDCPVTDELRSLDLFQAPPLAHTTSDRTMMNIDCGVGRVQRHP